MQPWFVLAVARTALDGILSTSLEAAEVRAEQPDQPWLQVLQSPEATLQQKDAACSALKREGTARSVPALAALLRHPDLSHSARHALETMPFPEAAEALRAALARTTGLVQVGIADSLGKRGDKAAVPGLAGLLANGDTQVATAAAAACWPAAACASISATSSSVVVHAVRMAVANAPRSPPAHGQKPLVTGRPWARASSSTPRIAGPASGPASWKMARAAEVRRSSAGCASQPSSSGRSSWRSR